MGNRLALPLAAVAVIGVGLALVGPGLAGGASAPRSGAPPSPPAARSTSRAAAPATEWTRGGRAASRRRLSELAPGPPTSSSRRGGCRCPTRPREPVRAPPAFGAADRHNLVAYIASLGGPGLPAPDIANGSDADGRRLFTENCAGCHSVLGAGGVITGASVPALQQASARQIAEAVRLGPYLMPRFGEGELGDRDVASVARYVLATRSPDDRGGWGSATSARFPRAWWPGWSA